MLEDVFIAPARRGRAGVGRYSVLRSGDPRDHRAACLATLDLGTALGAEVRNWISHVPDVESGRGSVRGAAVHLRYGSYFVSGAPHFSACWPRGRHLPFRTRVA